VNIRDGIEDFELLNILKEKLNSNPNQKIEKELEALYNLTPDHINYINNPEKLLDNKKKLLELLEII